ncbi:hypothetical protein O6P43_014575 [Quillaja saponaria]|uniref:Uncharacterized protein n=1 Tax=Quillaja saponaria TaxID=32244 RepID=A0AAD7LUZ0_QUISA|nr:hypothetical protein O6P43_014575 [Quillaja saponaria]
MKNHLVMELMEAQCSGLLDMLLAETVTKMDIFKLLSSLPSDSQTRYFCDDLFYEDDSIPKRIANYVLNGFYFLVLEIFRGLLDCSNYVKRPLVCGWVGKFSEEVVEVVSTADLQRRLDAQSFISVRHILLAVIDRTTVDAVKQLVIIALVICFSQCAEVPPYGIYLSAWKLANKHGSAKVRIEHLAVAAVREGASLGISMCYAVSSDENAVKFLNEYCEIQPESDYDDMDSFDELSICEPVEEYASRCLDVNFFNGSGDMRVSVDLGKGSQASKVLVEQ